MSSLVRVVLLGFRVIKKQTPYRITLLSRPFISETCESVKLKLKPYTRLQSFESMKNKCLIKVRKHGKYIIYLQKRKKNLGIFR